jgi:two-component system sensor histidine kinase/response regulator
MNIEGNHILVVDDVLTNLQITAQTLKEAGYKISLAESGESALNLLKQEMPDLILLDIMMPEMDGFEVCRHIKASEKLKDIPVIFITAINQNEDLVKGFNAGGVDYITKPFNHAELLIRVKNHLELSLSRKKLLETIKTRDKLYSIIAHDIRTPFNSIATMVDAVVNGIVDTQSAEFARMLKLLEKSSNETLTLLNNLLNWTKFQIGAINLNPRKLYINPVLADCIQLLSANAQLKSIMIEHIQTEEFMAYFDEITMHTVFRNILSNAIKFTCDQGIIKVWTEQRDNFMSVYFQDNGIGISYDVIQKIFNKNEPYTTRGTKNEQGSGLGLFLVKDLIEQNHGTIRVESQ